MRVILEGGRGAGKSTLAAELHKTLGVPVYRPFRGKDEHISPETIERMRAIGLPVNSWQEDLYVADMLAGTTGDVILDRSMPSALAYTSRACISDRARHEVLSLWADRIAAARVTLVLVEASPQVIAQRVDRPGIPGECKAISECIYEVAALRRDIPIWSVFTDHAKPEALGQALARRLALGTPNAMIGTLSPVVEAATVVWDA